MDDKINNELKRQRKLIIYTDGGARGNPGPAGCGAVIKDEGGRLLAEVSHYMGMATNNQAEYTALLLAMDKAAELGGQELEIFMDSELVVRQLNRQYKVRNGELAKLFILVYNKSQKFKKCVFTHIRREQNKEADKLANEAMDRKDN